MTVNSGYSGLMGRSYGLTGNLINAEKIALKDRRKTSEKKMLII
jgi:hypothetical protein